MPKLEIFHDNYWKPLEKFGFSHSFWNINVETVIFTWIILAIIISLCLFGRYKLKNKNSIFGFLIFLYVRSFNNLVTSTLGKFSFNHFAFVTSLFTFILICNIISLIPGLDEPTSEISTTLALGVCSFLYIQISAIRSKGFKEYIKEYFSPFFLLFPLNVIGELAKVISISFRLYGNIFGGSIIAKLWASSVSGIVLAEIVGIGINLIIVSFFILFEGFIQAFVFSMLVLTYLSVAISEGKH